MIGLDTNILVRFITQDDPVQSPAANAIFATRLTAAERGFVSIVAIVETTRVLERLDNLSDAAVAAAIERVRAALAGSAKDVDLAMAVENRF